MTACTVRPSPVARTSCGIGPAGSDARHRPSVVLYRDRVPAISSATASTQQGTMAAAVPSLLLFSSPVVSTAVASLPVSILGCCKDRTREKVINVLAVTSHRLWDNAQWHAGQDAVSLCPHLVVACDCVCRSRVRLFLMSRDKDGGNITARNGASVCLRAKRKKFLLYFFLFIRVQKERATFCMQKKPKWHLNLGNQTARAKKYRLPRQ